jgi:hypothetical protein
MHGHVYEIVPVDNHSNDTTRMMDELLLTLKGEGVVWSTETNHKMHYLLLWWWWWWWWNK